MKGLFIPEITAEMFKSGCLESIEALMAAGEIYDIEYQPWITCSERLPEDIRPVIVTWKNTDPASYYQYIVGKHFTGTACYKNGKWYWYSSTTEDMLAEYGRYDSEEFDEAIECIACRSRILTARKEKNMDDTISRQAAIDAVRTYYDDEYALADSIEELIEKLPSAQPERKKGEWIEREVTHIDDLEAKDIITAWQSCKCSVCGRYDTRPYMYYFNVPKYCSWCGAEMEVSK